MSDELKAGLLVLLALLMPGLCGVVVDVLDRLPRLLR